jgi:hypothetical protein
VQQSEKKTAIVVVHGVCPHPRYEIQDEFGSGLCDALNRISHLGKKWGRAILWPTILKDNCSSADLHATAVRIYPEGEDPNVAAHVYDVFEGYWSPIDKNQTNVGAVLNWLLTTLFAPLNSYAKLYAHRGKIAFDLAYVSLALALVIVLLGAAFAFAAETWRVYACLAVGNAPVSLDWRLLLSVAPDCGAPGFLAILTDPMKASSFIGLIPTARLLVALVGAFAGWQFIFSLTMEIQRSLSRKRYTGTRTNWRYFMQFVLVVVVGLCILVLSAWKMGPDGHSALLPTVALVIAVGFLKSALALIQGFFVNFIGDVQIYCTHDENSKFYDLRQKIVQTVETVVLEVLRSPKDQAPTATIPPPDEKGIVAADHEQANVYYDAVFVAGHSLGSTIVLDALINVHELVEEQGVDESAWRRLRGLITFGTSLEKTKFFFDARSPSFSAGVQQWRDGVYGHLFTDNPGVLRASNDLPKHPVGIYWANYWYFHDIVANEIASYRSPVAPGGRITLAAPVGGTLVCRNVNLVSALFRPLWHIWVHGDYLGDSRFWDSGFDAKKQPCLGAVDIIK